jgi:hypothetical protein
MGNVDLGITHGNLSSMMSISDIIIINNNKQRQQKEGLLEKNRLLTCFAPTCIDRSSGISTEHGALPRKKMKSGSFQVAQMTPTTPQQ